MPPALADAISAFHVEIHAGTSRSCECHCERFQNRSRFSYFLQEQQRLPSVGEVNFWDVACKTGSNLFNGSVYS